MKNTLEGRWGIDSNILVYVIDQYSEFFVAASKFFEYADRENFNLYVTQQNILEAQNVFKRYYDIKYETSYRLIMDLISVAKIKMINPLPSTLQVYSEPLKYLKRLQHFDMYLAATYMSNNVSSLFTNNEKDFKMIKDFNVVNPFKLSFEN